MNNKVGCVVLTHYFPVGSGGDTYRKKLLNILSSLENVNGIFYMYLTPSQGDHTTNVRNSPKIKDISLGAWDPTRNILENVVSHIVAELKATLHLIRLKESYGCVFFMSGNTFVLPVLITKYILRKNIIFLVSGISGITVWKYRVHRSIPMRLLKAVIEEFMMRISDFIVLESPRLKDVLNLSRYRWKVIQNGRMFVEQEKMQYTIPFSKRRNKIGYIGRLSPEKGIMNFVSGMLTLLENSEKSFPDDFEIIIGGKGSLGNKIKRLISQQNIYAKKIKMLGYIPDNEFTDVLNSLKLLVFPSPVKSPEGLPNIVLEALACGTPVLTTPTGAILDIIIDKKTGFIMKNNDPETISTNIVRALTRPELLEISRKGMRTVQKEFSFESASNRWQCIMQRTISRQNEVEGEQT